MADARDQPELHSLVTARFERSIAVPAAFFQAEADRIAECCWAMARRFHAGGRRLAFGNGAWSTEAGMLPSGLATVGARWGVRQTGLTRASGWDIRAACYEVV